jgi:hypothetical protein
MASHPDPADPLSVHRNHYDAAPTGAMKARRVSRETNYAKGPSMSSVAGDHVKRSGHEPFVWALRSEFRIFVP